MGSRNSGEKLREECLKIAGVLDYLQTQLPSTNALEQVEKKLPSIIDMKRYCLWLELQNTMDSIFLENSED